MNPSTVAAKRLIDFYSSMNAELQNIPAASGNKFTDSAWRITGGKSSNRVLHFEPFQTYQYFQIPIEIDFYGNTVELSQHDFAKLLVLRLCRRIHQNKWEHVRHGLHCIFLFLSTRGITSINSDNIEDFLETALTNQPKKFGWSPRLAPAKAPVMTGMRLDKVAFELRRLGVKTIVEDISHDSIIKAMNAVCIRVIGETLTDYRDSGSYDSLGLEIGKHYVDHCSSQFGKYYPYVYALITTQIEITEKYIQTINPKARKSTIKELNSYVNHLLRGGDPSEHGFARQRPFQFLQTFKLVMRSFRESYEGVPSVAIAFKIETIRQIIRASMLPQSRLDTEEFVRNYLLSMLGIVQGKSHTSIYAEYAETIRGEYSDYKIDARSFEEICLDAIENNRDLLPDNDIGLQLFLSSNLEDLNDLEHPGLFSSAIDLKDSASTAKISAIQTARDMAISFGVATFVALTGWRRSEFGFPESALSAVVNTDPLDNVYNPYRFNIRWHVPKSSDETLLDREITSQTFIIARLIGTIYQIIGKGLTLIPNAPTEKERQKERSIDKAVKLPWFHFAQKYELFTDLDTLDALCGVSAPSEQELSKLRILKEQFVWGNQEFEIRRIRDTVRAQLPLWRLLSANNPTIGEHIRDYHKGCAVGWATEAIDTFLSLEEKDRLHELQKIDKDAVQYFRESMIGEMRYPTPHGFRHIWAEAVLNRYSGDVGRIIRSNFKHLDHRFFLAYIRDKDMMKIYTMASRVVINRIVRKHLQSIQNTHREFGGHFDRYISKVVAHTKIKKFDELVAMANKIESEVVVDIKANAWGFCLPREGTQRSGKCSEGGVLQRHNASPSLCLDCINCQINTSHVNGIVIYTADHLRVLSSDLNPELKEPSLPPVRAAAKRIAELAKNAGEKHPDHPTMISYLKVLTASIKDAERELSILRRTS